MGSAKIKLRSVQIENLRGFRDAVFPFDRSHLLIVGPNNSGKTSLLRLLDWVFNALDVDALDSPASESLQEFLLPARTTRHKARRITLEVEILDGNWQRKFHCRGSGITQLRIAVRMTPKPRVWMALGKATRSESARTDKRAVTLLERLRDQITVVYVPAFRDAASRRFEGLFADVLQGEAAAVGSHAVQGGAPGPYKNLKNHLSGAKKIVEAAASDFWPKVEEQLSRGFTLKSKVHLDSDPEEFAAWLAARVSVAVSTGSHDDARVEMRELGSGLQSQLYLAFATATLHDNTNELWLLVEEPEAFLHPAQQRSAARFVMVQETANVVASTHSHLVVEEAKFGDVIICRGHKFYAPRLSEERRAEINESLLRSDGAEMMFARSVILVEGEGDRQFFDQLRRRLAANDLSGVTDELVVVPVGSKTQFRPWIELLESYVHKKKRPINWLVVADADAATEVRRAFKDAGTPWSDRLAELGQAVANKQGERGWSTATASFNKRSRMNKPRTTALLLDVDLESAAFGKANAKTVVDVARKAGLGKVSKKRDLIRKLGSKDPTCNPTQNGLKKPWIRGYMGSTIPFTELGASVRSVLEHWLHNADISTTKARTMLSAVDEQ